jgi:hypothetical protein
VESTELREAGLKDYIKINLYKHTEFSFYLYIGFKSDHECSVYSRHAGKEMEYFTYYYHKNLVVDRKQRHWFAIQLLSYVVEVMELQQCNASMYRPRTKTEVYCFQFPQEPKKEIKARVENFLNVFMKEFEDLTNILLE